MKWKKNINANNKRITFWKNKTQDKITNEGMKDRRKGVMETEDCA